jgi:hypothetical protein
MARNCRFYLFDRRKDEHSEIARAFRKIEGLNLKMKNKKVVASRDAKSHSPQKNSWQALRAAREKTAPDGRQFPFFSQNGAR